MRLSNGTFTLAGGYFMTIQGTSETNQRPNTLRMRAVFSRARKLKNAMRQTWLQPWTLLPLINKGGETMALSTHGTEITAEQRDLLTTTVRMIIRRPGRP